MSALAGPGDLAGSPGEMAERAVSSARRLGCWYVGSNLLGLKAQPLPRDELLERGGRHLPPASEAHPAPIYFPLAEPHVGEPRRRGDGQATILRLERGLRPHPWEIPVGSSAMCGLVWVVCL